MNEDQLILGCKNGEREAQKALYHKYAAKMLAICMRYIGEKMEAEDILQDGFIKIFTHFPKYESTGSLGGWIRTVMVNTAIEHYRKNKRNIIDLTVDKYPHQAFDEGLIERIDAKQILKMIARLPDGYRQVFNLYAIEGYKHQEIGIMLGISEGTSKSQYARAKKHLQEIILKNYKIDIHHVERGF